MAMAVQEAQRHETNFEPIALKFEGHRRPAGEKGKHRRQRDSAQMAFRAKSKVATVSSTARRFPLGQKRAKQDVKAFDFSAWPFTAEWFGNNNSRCHRVAIRRSCLVSLCCCRGDLTARLTKYLSMRCVCLGASTLEALGFKIGLTSPRAASFP